MRLVNTLVIVGMGLIGGSIGLAAKKRGLAGKVIGVSRRESTLRQALRFRAVDEATHNLAEASAKADLLILATPVPSIAAVAKEAAKKLPSECIVTDVGSTKEKIVQECEALFAGRFVGSHPMTGSEKSGIQYAKELLFDNTVCILTPTNKTKIKTTQLVQHFWEQLGARVKILKPKEHDAVAAVISHFPHLLAYSLILSLKNSPRAVEDVLSFAGGGFKDMTRIAASPAELWVEILFENKTEVLQSLKNFSGLLQTWEDILSRGNKKKALQLLSEAQAIRERLK